MKSEYLVGAFLELIGTIDLTEEQKMQAHHAGMPYFNTIMAENPADKEYTQADVNAIQRGFGEKLAAFLSPEQMATWNAGFVDADKVPDEAVGHSL